MDYLNASLLLEKLVAVSMGEHMINCIPIDTSILLMLMKTNGYLYRYLIGNHTSLLPLHNRSTVFMEFFDYINFYIPNFKRELKGKVENYMPYRKMWVIMASNNSYMIEWLKYQDRLAGKQVSGKWYEFLRIVRNVICHKMKLLMNGKVYQAAEVENMLQAIFPALLPNIQEFLWKEGCLRDFNMETYFMHRKITKWSLNKRGH
ncbi:uncharacterized protein LOC120700010 [Panicum virgatum]|nr:uncharacterized protein LOC120700010 [Panicum virgatum]